MKKHSGKGYREYIQSTVYQRSVKSLGVRQKTEDAIRMRELANLNLKPCIQGWKSWGTVLGFVRMCRNEFMIYYLIPTAVVDSEIQLVFGNYLRNFVFSSNFNCIFVNICLYKYVLICIYTI